MNNLIGWFWFDRKWLLCYRGRAKSVWDSKGSTVNCVVDVISCDGRGVNAWARNTSGICLKNHRQSLQMACRNSPLQWHVWWRDLKGVSVCSACFCVWLNVCRERVSRRRAAEGLRNIWQTCQASLFRATLAEANHCLSHKPNIACCFMHKKRVHLWMNFSNVSF